MTLKQTQTYTITPGYYFDDEDLECIFNVLERSDGQVNRKIEVDFT